VLLLTCLRASVLLRCFLVCLHGVQSACAHASLCMYCSALMYICVHMHYVYLYLSLVLYRLGCRIVGVIGV
jgi:hypothetical protein